jgi:hypothetical protein
MCVYKLTDGTSPLSLFRIEGHGALDLNPTLYCIYLRKLVLNNNFHFNIKSGKLGSV